MEIPISEISIIGFLKEQNIKNERGDLIDFYDRPFLFDPMRDWSRFQVYKKCAQIGMSTTMALKSLYAARYKGWNIIHTFPTDSDAREFVTTKTNKILQANEVFAGIQSDNIERKQIGDRFLHYKGTISKSAAIATTADLLISDEKDRGDQQKHKDFESRLIASDYKGVWSLSNPSIEGNGVDPDWELSDKKEWFVTCKDGHSCPMTFPASINQKTRKFQCSECGLELSDDDRRRGEWVKTGDENAKWSGYHITLLIAPWITADYILDQWADGKNPEYFHNFILGEPYSPGDTKIDKHVILDNWTPKNIETGQYYLGVDVGNIKHYVIGSEKGILKVGTFTNWHELDKILMAFNPITVMDAMPDNTMAHHYKDTFPNFFICHFSRDQENNTIIRWGEKEKQGIVFADRSRIIDRIVMELLEGKILFALPSDKDFRVFLDHCSSLRRVKETNALGIERYVWDTLEGKEDHYFFALLYYYLAIQSHASGSATIIGAGEPPKSIVQSISGFKNNLKEELEAREYGY